MAAKINWHRYGTKLLVSTVQRVGATRRAVSGRWTTIVVWRVTVRPDSATANSTFSVGTVTSVLTDTGTFNVTIHSAASVRLYRCS